MSDCNKDCDNCKIEDFCGYSVDTLGYAEFSRVVEEHDKQIRADVIDEYKWISVKDKMPKDCGKDWVLVLPYAGDYRCIPTVAEYRRGHWYGHTLCTEDDCIDGEDSPLEVRFWKPIYDEFQLKYFKRLKEQNNEKTKAI